MSHNKVKMACNYGRFDLIILGVFMEKRKYVHREVLKGYMNRHQAWKLLKKFLGDNVWSVVTFYDHLDRMRLKTVRLGERQLYKFSELVKAMPLDDDAKRKVLKQYYDERAKEIMEPSIHRLRQRRKTNESNRNV